MGKLTKSLFSSSLCFTPKIVTAKGRHADGKAGHGPVLPLQVAHAVAVETFTFVLILSIKFVLKHFPIFCSIFFPTGSYLVSNSIPSLYPNSPTILNHPRSGNAVHKLKAELKEH